MFKKMMNLAIVAILVATSIAISAPRQKLSDDEKEALKAYQTEMQNFGQSEIHPKLLEIKNNFDKSISQSDLATLNSLRTKAASERKNNMRQRGQQQKNMKGNRQAMDSAQKAQFKNDMQSYKADLDKIISNNPKQFDQLKNNLDQFTNDIKPKIDAKHNELLAKYPVLKNRPNLGQNQVLQRIATSPDAFLLWDGNMMMGRGRY
jgi:cytochrome c556